MLRGLYYQIKKKGAVDTDYLIWVLLIVIALFVIVGGIFLLSGRGDNYITQIKDMLRVG